MARSFNGSSDYLRVSSLAVSAPPFTMACWFQATNTTAAHTLMGVFDDASTNHRHYLEANGGVAGDPVGAVSKQTGTTFRGATSVGYSANTWTHACGVWASTTSRTGYINGGNAGSDTNSCTPSGLDRTSLGVIDSLTQANFLSGIIAYAGIWDVALTTDEISALAEATHPLRIRPASLIACWDINGLGATEQDRIGAFPLTIAGTTRVSQPRIIMPRPKRPLFHTVAAPAGGKPHHYYYGALAA